MNEHVEPENVILQGLWRRFFEQEQDREKVVRRLHQQAGPEAVIALAADSSATSELREKAAEYLVRDVDSRSGQKIRDSIHHLSETELNDSLRKTFSEIVKVLECFSGRTNDLDYLFKVASTETSGRVLSECSYFLLQHSSGPRRNDVSRAIALVHQRLSELDLDILELVMPEEAKIVRTNRTEMN